MKCPSMLPENSTSPAVESRPLSLTPVHPELPTQLTGQRLQRADGAEANLLILDRIRVDPLRQASRVSFAAHIDGLALVIRARITIPHREVGTTRYEG